MRGVTNIPTISPSYPLKLFQQLRVGTARHIRAGRGKRLYILHNIENFQTTIFLSYKLPKAFRHNPPSVYYVNPPIAIPTADLPRRASARWFTRSPPFHSKWLIRSAFVKVYKSPSHTHHKTCPVISTGSQAETHKTKWSHRLSLSFTESNIFSLHFGSLLLSLQGKPCF